MGDMKGVEVTMDDTKDDGRRNTNIGSFESTGQSLKGSSNGSMYVLRDSVPSQVIASPFGPYCCIVGSEEEDQVGNTFSIGGPCICSYFTMFG